MHNMHVDEEKEVIEYFGGNLPAFHCRQEFYKAYM